MPPFRKSRADAPVGYFAWEAAGLRWLGAATDAGGVPVATVLQVGPTHLDLVRLDPVPPTRAAAAAFGADLARTHDPGGADVGSADVGSADVGGANPAFGAGPPHWLGDGFFGPTDQPLPLSLTPHFRWSAFYAAERLTPITQGCRDAGVFDATEAALLDRLAATIDRHDTDEAPSRIHGDLWSGNVIWTSAGATLIDPAAHHGHREADLAMLALFGSPHLDVTIAAYQDVRPLAEGWRERVALHQLYPLAVHALLFGGGYAAQTISAARRYA